MRTPLFFIALAISKHPIENIVAHERGIFGAILVIISLIFTAFFLAMDLVELFENGNRRR